MLFTNWSPTRLPAALLFPLLLSACRRSEPRTSADTAAPLSSAAASSDVHLGAPAARDTTFPDTAGWTRFRSERWGLSFAHPPGVPVRVVGPADAACDGEARGEAAADSVAEGSRDSSLRAVHVSFTRLAFDSIALRHGFRRVAEGWALIEGGEMGGEPEAGSPDGDLRILRGSQLQRTFDAGEGATEQAATTLAVLRRRDECQVVLRYDEVESRGAELPAADVFRTLTVVPPASALP